MSTTTIAPTIAGAELRLHELAALFGGELRGDAKRVAAAYALDSRAAGPGVVFFALSGQRTDGHNFLGDVLARGTTAAVVRRGAAVPPSLAVILVDEPAEALAALGRHFRDRWPLQVVGITGSAGKTTTKDVTASLLAARFQVFKSEGNLNTTVGLPLTLTRRRPSDAVAVVELGMSVAGELRRVAAIARPNVAVITNVGLAHVGNFASIDDVAREKGSILSETAVDGTFVANADDPRVMALARAYRGRVVTFGLDAPADVAASRIEPLGASGSQFLVTSGGVSGNAVIPLVGLHQVRNAVAGLAVARALGVDPIELLPAVAQLSSSSHRGGLMRLSGGVSLLDDSYNANPAAVLAALEALKTLPGKRRVAILGDMLELGGHATAAHEQVGRRAAGVVDVLIAVGPESRSLADAARAAGCSDVHHEVDATGAARLACDLVADGDAVLVKGSRGIGLETVVAALCSLRGGGSSAGGSS